MAEFKIKTKNQSNIKDKPRVYFTAHPDGYKNHFDRITRDILKTHDCAIYYTENMNEPLDGENLSLDLERMNLVVVPVTLKLLTEECRAMTVEVPYAIKRGIPILPIMMEDGLLEIYSKRDKFGELQYISPLTSDTTEVSYESKLENRLLSTLTSDELAKRVREVFDARIFLSYRKRDRVYANKLLSAIHGDDRLRDIAVWYDEFLTPGESYVENIDSAMNESKLFMLLVTPNVLDDPNFVKDTEYPTAKRLNMPVFPVVMAKTDMTELYEKYEGLPECAVFDGSLCDKIAEILLPYATAENDTDPERCFLLGIAYSDGLEVEINRERGMKLIKLSADAGYSEAIGFMYEILKSRGDYLGALEYAKKFYETHSAKHGEDEEKMSLSVGILAEAYGNAGNYTDAVALYERKYDHLKNTLGEENESTVWAMMNLATARSNAGDYLGALRLYEVIYATQVERHGEKHAITLHSLAELATAYGNAGNHQKAFELKEKSFHLNAEQFGIASSKGLSALNNYAFAFVQINELDKAHELFEMAHSVAVQMLGEDHPETLNVLTNLAHVTFMMGMQDEGIKLARLAVGSMIRVLGEEHPATIRAIDNLAFYNKKVGRLDEAIALNEHSLALYKKVLGEKHPSTATSMNNLGNAYVAKKDYAKGISLLHAAYLTRAEVIGEYHQRTVETLELLAWALVSAGDFVQARDAYLILIGIYDKTKPTGHPDRVVALYNLSSCYYAANEMDNAISYMRRAYNEARIGYGDSHPRTKKYKQVLDMLTGD